MKKRVLLAVLFCAAGFANGQNNSEIKKILANINPEAIRATMTFLSDDLLEGRDIGSRGFNIGSKYMETQFMSLGLKPGVGGTNFVQKVPLVKASVNEKGSSFTISGPEGEQPLIWGKDFLLNAYFPNSASNVKAPLVFVGYGISAPELKYDDYAGIDVRGKIVVYMNDAPTSWPSNERAYLTTADAKYSEALKRGAVGVVTFNLPSNKRFNWDGAVRRSGSGSYKWVGENGTPGNSYPELKAVGTFNNQSLGKLFSHSPVSIEKIYEMAALGKSQSFPLDLTAEINVATTSTRVESSNLVGYIEGSDPKLKNEYIVYTAHLDHLGISTNPNQADVINNGAHDDASGNAILLEIIRAYRSLSSRPKRSILFAVVTGEERGLLGSDYLVNNFPLAGGKVVADLSIDMPFFFHPVLDIVAYGADHSSLGLQTQKAAKALGLKISPDPFPEQVVFIRSDHFSFIKKGIPALFIKSGFMTVPSDKIDRSKSDVEWRSTIYHTPKDDMNQPFDFDAAAVHVKVNFLIGYYVSGEKEAPTWNKGDYFGKRFGDK